MWIPTPVYERLPHFWLLAGILFMSSGLYLGFDYSWSYFYFAVGVGCCLKSMWIFSIRLAARKPAGEQKDTNDRRQSESDLDEARSAA